MFTEYAMERLITADGLKRRVLIVDDEMINREMLGLMLSDSYEIAYAENGKEAMDMLTAEGSDFSLVLLDLLMPVMDGFEVINRCRADERLRYIPIIVMTSEKSAEVRSIRAGAVDFITKPYNMPEVILARCERIIELSEGKSIIRSTERDKLTGLYTRGYFFAYIQRLLTHLTAPMDALVLNINRFHIINELLGHKEGDNILSTIGKLLGDRLIPLRGIACRSESDTFFLFLERQEEYESLIQELQNQLCKLTKARDLRLRAGIYHCPNDLSEPEQWFSRAKAACDRIRDSYGVLTASFNNELYKQTVYRERLSGDVQSAIDNRSFVVYYQPKYRIQGDRPVLASAEALVRWIHPEFGFVSPGDFIPLFEKNGLISKVDYYVWREAAAQMKRWREQYGITLPVSVNVSRVDIFDIALESKLTGIMKEFALNQGDLMLEITESAYAENAEQLTEVVTSLRKRGFKIEMDDFGSGYSSLNMLTSIPFDVLKLDMQFVRYMLSDSKKRRLVEVVMDIADFLNVSVVAEGVEEEEQFSALKEMGCDIVQGYYFSPPVNAEKFGKLIEDEVRLSKGCGNDAK